LFGRALRLNTIKKYHSGKYGRLSSHRPVAFASSSSSTSHSKWSSSSSLKASSRVDMPKLSLSKEEEELFDLFLSVVNDGQLQTTVRVAGGWVRDKLLQQEASKDIDIALDNMSGEEFVNAMNEWYKTRNKTGIKLGIIRSNPDKSKHLETATANIGNFDVDFVNLRTETYADSSRIPIIDIGTPLEDAMRRDLTINSLFYNINDNKIEDYTNKGINRPILYYNMIQYILFV